MQFLNLRNHQHQKQKNPINPFGTLTLILALRNQHQLLKVRHTCTKRRKRNVKKVTLQVVSFCYLVAGKGRGRKRKGSGSEDEYSPMKKTAKPPGRVSA